MKLVVVCQIYNELKSGNLLRFLCDVPHWAHAIVFYDDGSDDGTYEALLEFQQNAPVGNKVYIIRSDENDFKNEMEHKQHLLDRAIEIGADWIMWLDADEVIEPRGHKEIKALLQNKELDGYAFHQINLWRSDRFYRVDNQYNDGIFVRLWRNNGRLRYDPKPGLHQRPYPLGVDKVADSDIQIIHYGFATDEAIVKKYHTYKAHGQEGWALSRLVDESTLTVRRIKPEWMRGQLVGADLEVFNTKVADKV